MKNTTLIALEDQLWKNIGKSFEPKFAFIGSSAIVRGAFLRVAAISHPYFGRAKLCVLSSESPQFSAEFGKMELAKRLGILTIETFENIEELVRDAIVISGENIDFPMEQIVASFKLEDSIDTKSSVVIDPDDPYRFIYACLNLYGTPLDELRLPTVPDDGPLVRDWHYLGPSRDYQAYRAIEDELLLSLKSPDGSLCPEESWPILIRSLREEEVSGKDFYLAIRSCYGTPCLLRDMASYQHDTWLLRTLAFHDDPTSKSHLMIPYPELLTRELAKLKNLTPEESFPIDILYSDFLVPLYFLRTLLLQ